MSRTRGVNFTPVVLLSCATMRVFSGRSSVYFVTTRMMQRVVHRLNQFAHHADGLRVFFEVSSLLFCLRFPCSKIVMPRTTGGSGSQQSAHHPQHTMHGFIRGAMALHSPVSSSQHRFPICGLTAVPCPYAYEQEHE